jgi:chemotaxis protein CheD
MITRPSDADPAHRVFLMPGSIYVASRPALVTTILGSCIAVCLWDSAHRLGGMNHFVLPANTDGDRSARYGDVAIERLMEGLLGLGCHVGDLRAKVFGGAAVLPAGPVAATVGARNLQMALERLRHHGVPVVAHRTGGERGLLIRLNTQTGEVALRKVASGPAGDPPGTPRKD